MATSRLLDRFRGEHQSEGGESARRTPSVPLTRASRIAVPLLAGAVLVGAEEAKADTPTWDPSTIVEALPVGADDASSLEFWYGRDSAGNEFAIVDTDGDGDGTYYMWNGSSWDQVPFTGLSLEGNTNLHSAQIIDGELYIHGSGAYQYSGSGLSWGTEVDLSSIESVGGGAGFTYDSYTDAFYEAYEDTHLSPSAYAVFEATATRSFIDDTPDHLYHPASCGDGMMYISWVDSSYSDYLIYQYNLDDGTLTEVTDVDQGYAPTCEYDDSTGVTTLYYSADDGTGNWTIYSITGQHTLETDTTTCYADADSDGYGDASTAEEDVEECSSGFVEDDTDCDDTAADVNPGETEVPYDGDDNDCDDSTPDDDLDSDGYDSTATGGTDCDDDDASINPGETETCDGVDTNCSGDESDATDADTWYEDSDGDTYGDPSSSTESCTQPSGYVADNTDCDDTDAATNPAASEICDGYDNDCDGAIPSDEQDSDTDGWMECEGDCDDSRDDVNPDEAEQCDDVDHDCDGTTDNDVEDQTWYQDSDGDGYGDDLTATVDCAQPGTDYITQGGDCDDASADVNPSEEDVAYDGVDQDCDGGDYEPDTYWTDCTEIEATSKSANVVYIAVPAGLGDDYICEVRYLLAEEGDDGEVPNSYLTAGSSLDIGYDSDSSSGTPNPYYVNHLYEGTTIETDTHDSETDVLEVVQDSAGVDYYVFGREGCVSALSVGNGVVNGLVIEPTIILNRQDGSYGDVYREYLEEVSRFTEPVEFELDLEDGEVTIIEGETGDPDTGDTAEDTGKKDTGETPDPPGDCGEGCSIASAPNPDLGRVMGGTGLLATIALGAALTRRRQTKDGQVVAETDGYHWDN